MSKYLLDKTSERRAPDKHTMGSARQKRIDVLDICLLQPAFEFVNVLANNLVVITANDLEKEQLLVDLIRFH